MVYRRDEQYSRPEIIDIRAGTIARADGRVEIDPALMGRYVQQQDMPEWDIARISSSREAFLAYMHFLWADEKLSIEACIRDMGFGGK